MWFIRTGFEQNFCYLDLNSYVRIAKKEKENDAKCRTCSSCDLNPYEESKRLEVFSKYFVKCFLRVMIPKPNIPIPRKLIERL